MKDEARDTAKYDISGEDSTVKMCAIQLRLEAKIVYLQCRLRLWRLAFVARKSFLNLQLRLVDLLLYLDEAYSKCASHIVSWFKRESASREGRSHSGEAGVRVFEPRTSGANQESCEGHDGGSKRPNVRAEAGPTAKRQARVVENAPAHCAGLAF